LILPETSCPIDAAGVFLVSVAELIKVRDAIADVKENLQAIPSDTECGAVALTSLETAYWIRVRSQRIILAWLRKSKNANRCGVPPQQGG